MTEHEFLCDWPALDCSCGYAQANGVCVSCGEDVPRPDLSDFCTPCLLEAAQEARDNMRSDR